METLFLPQLLLVAGNGRNTGKTSFICSIIEKFSRDRSIYAIKITPHFHPEYPRGISLLVRENLFLGEETDTGNGKDSARMLAAGASKAFFIMARDEALDNAFAYLLSLIPAETMMVCESGGLRNYVTPGLFFLLSRQWNDVLKPGNENLYKLADRKITFDETGFDLSADNIDILDNQWILI